MTDVTNSKNTKREYHSDDLIIYWDLSLCSHAGKCKAMLPQVFDPNKRPWVTINAATAEEIIKAIDACPSGALRYKLTENSKVDPKLAKGPGSIDYKGNESADGAAMVEIKMVKDGPFVVKGLARILSPEGSVLRESQSMVLCRCGKTKNPPFCDGSHAHK